MNMITTMFRTLMSVLDKGIYALLVMVYDLMNSIANTQLFSSRGEGIGIIFDNIYIILGVIMLFKLAFSLLTYVINPDAMSDKNNGMGSLIKNVMIVIALTLTVPIIFDKAMELQRVVLKEDIIGRIITGKQKTGDSAVDSSAGKLMATNVLAGFVRPDPDLYPECSNVIFVGENVQNECKAPSFDKYFAAVQAGDYKTLLSSDIVQQKNSDNQFVYDYMMLFTSLAGLAVTYILLIFCINIAVRSVKLMFLQLIAPIPIVSYIDPKGQKGMFNKWVSISIKTYLDLFIRLAGIYFALFLIQEVILSGQLKTTNSLGDTVSPGFFVNVFMIFGVLLFAKELPKMVEELTGAKLSGGFNLNPMKAYGPGAGLAVGTGIGAVGGGIAAYNASRAIGDGRGKAILQSLRGGTTGAVRGGLAGVKAGGKNVFGSASLAAGKAGSSIYANAGTGFFERQAARAQKAMGIKTYKQRTDARADLLKNFAGYKDRLKTQANFDTTNRDFKYSYSDSNGVNHEQNLSGNTKALKQTYDDLVNSGTATQDQITSARTAWEESQKLSITYANTAEIKAIKSEMAGYVSDNSNDIGDFDFKGVKISSVNSESSYDDINSAVIAAQNAQVNITSGDEKYRQAQKVDRATGQGNSGKK